MVALIIFALRKAGNLIVIISKRGKQMTGLDISPNYQIFLWQPIEFLYFPFEITSFVDFQHVESDVLGLYLLDKAHHLSEVDLFHTEI